MERGGSSGMHRRAAATGNALSPTVDRRVCRTSRDIDEAERSRHLASYSLMHAYDHIFTPGYHLTAENHIITENNLNVVHHLNCRVQSTSC